MSSGSQFTSVQVAGNLLPSDLLGKVVEAGELDGLRPTDYHLAPGEGLRQAASRAWDYLTGVWSSYRRDIDALGENAPTTGITRERWLLILLRELGFGRVPATPSGGLTVGDSEEDQFPVSHRWGPVPIHLLGWGIELDRRTKGVAGAAGAAPQSMVQELLNRSDEYLWGIVANGQRLRLLRDSTSLVGSAYVEFDLEAIFDGELFSDFVVLYLLAHQSRFDVAEGAGPESCWLEAWRTTAAEQGTRALERLRGGVEEALATLGTGFLQHPDNDGLRNALASGRLSKEDYQRALLRVAYRLLFWLITEARGALLDPYADGKARDRYERYFSANRLRELARRRRGDRHGDLWRSVRLVFDGLAADGGRPELGLPGLGGLFDSTAADEPLETAGEATSGPRRAELPNEALLGAMRALTVVREKGGGQRRLVDFRNLGADELGSVYESLLELHPHIDTQRLTFTLHNAAGNERKLTGSYYTPGSLIQSLLDSALDPLLDEAQRTDDPVEALLNVTVCDPACGSGHFLVAAARRIAKRVAAIETGEAEPSPSAVQAALRRVVGRCIHGVDANPMAAELAKVALWLEAMEPGKPLSFLDANIRVGNSLLGVTPKLLADGIPNEAFKALEGDDKAVVKRLTKANKEQRAGVFDLFSQGVGTTNAALARATAGVLATPETLAEVRRLQKQFDDVERQRSSAQLTADTWCAAFVQPKTADAEPAAITQGTLLRAAGDEGLPEQVAARVRGLADDYGFFHWHLEFPHIFQVPEAGDVDPDTGWSGGFTCVLGNPPWDRVKLQEQEFFATRAPDIAKAPNASKRKKLIDQLAESDEAADQTLYEAFIAARHRAEGTSHFLHNSGRYPLTGRGDINTYPVFAENDRTIIGPRGRAGVVLPTGIATDATTQYFFRDLVETASIASLYDFENRKGIFPGVHRSFKFCLFTMSGRAVRETNARFAFFALDVADLDKPDMVFSLTPEEIKLLNPNTQTLPVFRSRRDAEITLGIYRRVPVLVNENDPDNGNPWGVSFMTMFHMSNDSHLFHTREDLESAGWTIEGNIFTRGDDRMLPLYEAKMIHHYDHRWATYERDGTIRDVTAEEKQDPNFAPMPRYWVAEKEVDKRLDGKWNRNWLLGWRDICRATDERTTIAAVLPLVAVGNNLPLMFPETNDARQAACLIANLASFVQDYAARLKVGGTHLNFFIYQQLPVLPPTVYDRPTPWDPGTMLNDWIAARAIDLLYTEPSIAGIVKDLGKVESPPAWRDGRREILRAEIDASYFHLYGIQRADVDYIMDTFPIVKREDEYSCGEYRTKHLILDIYDGMADAIATGEPYESSLVHAPGQGSYHSDPSGR